MYRHGHLGVNLIIAAPFTRLFLALDRPYLAIVAPLAIAFPSRLPDNDLKYTFLKHRGFSHTVWAALLFGIVASAAIYPLSLKLDVVTLPLTLLVGLGFGTIGYLGHIVGDSLTPMGIRPFAPLWDKHISFSLCTADSLLGNATLVFLGVLSLVLAVGVNYGLLPEIVDGVTSLLSNR